MGRDKKGARRVFDPCRLSFCVKVGGVLQSKMRTKIAD